MRARWEHRCRVRDEATPGGRVTWGRVVRMEPTGGRAAEGLRGRYETRGMHQEARRELGTSRPAAQGATGRLCRARVAQGEFPQLYSLTWKDSKRRRGASSSSLESTKAEQRQEAHARAKAMQESTLCVVAVDAQRFSGRSAIFLTPPLGFPLSSCCAVSRC
jgi:hypothetical protein